MPNYILSIGGGTEKAGVQVGGTTTASTTGTSKFDCNLPAYFSIPPTIKINGTSIAATYIQKPASAVGSATVPTYLNSGAINACTGYTSVPPVMVHSAGTTYSCKVTGITGLSRYIVAAGTDTSTTNIKHHWVVWSDGWKEVFSERTVTTDISDAWGGFKIQTTTKWSIAYPSTDQTINPGWTGFTAVPKVCNVGVVCGAPPGNGASLIVGTQFTQTTAQTVTMGVLRGTVTTGAIVTFLVYSGGY